jgi:hypothetical protein
MELANCKLRAIQDLKEGDVLLTPYQQEMVVFGIFKQFHTLNVGQLVIPSVKVIVEPEKDLPPLRIWISKVKVLTNEAMNSIVGMTPSQTNQTDDWHIWCSFNVNKFTYQKKQTLFCILEEV